MPGPGWVQERTTSHIKGQHLIKRERSRQHPALFDLQHPLASTWLAVTSTFRCTFIYLSDRALVRSAITTQQIAPSASHIKVQHTV